MEVDDIKEKAKDLTGHVTNYVETFYKLTVLKATQKATDVGSTLISVLAIVIFGFFIILFGSLALAWWIGDLLESRALGFGAVGGFYLVVLLVIVLLRKKIIFPYFRNLLIRKFYG